MNKQIVLLLYNVILLNNKLEWTIVTYNDLYESQRYESQGMYESQRYFAE